MSASGQRDPWRYAAFLLWMVFFITGLSPEPVFFLLRQTGGVLTQRALVNSPHVITVAFAGYIALFVYHRCRGAGDSSGAAQDKALQMGVVALLAFMPVDLGAVLSAHKAPILEHRVLLYGAALLKLVAWWSLLALFIRYYLFKADAAFAEIGSLFPSTRGNTAGQESDVLDTDSGRDSRDGKE
ncbi:MAG: hypothetical protein NTU83_00455 [Candidatus Hydrogenedentes bacterium]|nr:hypothetical protein [Candidatus Hydrogenedentota bacterium]